MNKGHNTYKMICKIKSNRKIEKGSTYIEILLSVALLCIIVIPLIGALVSAANNNTLAKDKIEASALAEKVMSEIKAWEAIPVGERKQYTEVDKTRLVPYYEIIADDSGNVAKSTDVQYSCDLTEANNYDLELIINKNKNTGKIDCVEIKPVDGESNVINFTGTADAEKALVFELNKNEGNFVFSLYEKSKEKGEEKKFTPKDTDKIKLKIVYSEDIISTSDRLKVYTNIEIEGIDFKLYQINIDEDNSKVGFINIGKAPFEVVYVDSKIYDYKYLNQIYKITVSIEKDNLEIYKTSSYVRKQQQYNSKTGDYYANIKSTQR